jgi:hypothetical protein
MLHTARLFYMPVGQGRTTGFHSRPRLIAGLKKRMGLEVCVLGVWASVFVLSRQVNRISLLGEEP